MKQENAQTAEESYEKLLVRNMIRTERSSSAWTRRFREADLKLLNRLHFGEIKKNREVIKEQELDIEEQLIKGEVDKRDIFRFLILWKECVLLQDVKASGPDSNYYMSNPFLLVFFGESWLIRKEEFINTF